MRLYEYSKITFKTRYKQTCNEHIHLQNRLNFIYFLDCWNFKGEVPCELLNSIFTNRGVTSGLVAGLLAYGESCPLATTCNTQRQTRYIRQKRNNRDDNNNWFHIEVLSV